MAEINLLRSVNGSTPVTAYHDAAIFYSIFGNAILGGIYNAMKATINVSLRKITVQSGMALYGGRQVEIPLGNSIELDVSELIGQSRIYLILKIVVTASGENETAEIYASPVSEATGTSPMDGVGTHKISIGHFTKLLIGNLYLYSKTLSVVEVGEAQRAYALLPSGSIGYQPVSSIFTDDFLSARHALTADSATVARGFVGGEKNRVDEKLFMTNRKVYLAAMCVIFNPKTTIEIASDDDVSLPMTNNPGSGKAYLQVIYGINGSRNSSWSFAQTLESTNPEITYGNCRYTFNFTLGTVNIHNNSSSAVSLVNPYFAALIGPEGGI